MKREVLIVRPAESDHSLRAEARQLPLGSQDEVETALRTTFGRGTSRGNGEWMFDAPGFSVLAALGSFAEVDSVTLDVWGEADPVPYIRELCLPRGWEAFDLESGEALTDLDLRES
jgi:hypothetical protein